MARYRNKSKRHARLSRRQALSILGGGVMASGMDPLSLLLDSMVDGFIQRAQAQSPIGVLPRNYCCLFFNGGLVPWLWHIPLQPWSTSMPFIPCGQVKTTYVNGQLQYATVDVTVDGTTYRLPKLWGSSIFRPGGGEMPMSELFQELLIVRGIQKAPGIINLGHGEGIQLDFLPASGAPSVAGMVASRSQAPFPAVVADDANMRPSNFFRSPNGIGAVVSNYDHVTTNPLERLMGSFSLGSEANQFNEWQLNSKLNTALLRLKNYARLNNPGADQVYTNTDNAIALMRTAAVDLVSRWNELYSKYSALISDCKQLEMVSGYQISRIPGVTDERIPPTNDPRSWNGSGKFVENNDFRSLVSDQTTIPYLAEAFSLAEFILCYPGAPLSNSIVLPAMFSGPGGSIRNLNVVSSSGAPSSYDVDEHEIGIHTSLPVASWMYRVIASCLYELIQQVKSVNRWSETVIHIASDFGRDATQVNGVGAGSDHANYNDNLVAFSGALPNAPIVIGNISADPYVTAPSGVPTFWGGPHPGTWGCCGKVNFQGSYLNMGHKVSTLATLLRVPSPSSNNASLLSENSNGSFSPVIGPAQNKANPYEN